MEVARYRGSGAPVAAVPVSLLVGYYRSIGAILPGRRSATQKERIMTYTWRPVSLSSGIEFEAENAAEAKLLIERNFPFKAGNLVFPDGKSILIVPALVD